MPVARTADNTRLICAAIRLPVLVPGILKFHRPFRALFGRAEISAEL
jgi:hypothetical protein